jgi:hypothetical protein
MVHSYEFHAEDRVDFVHHSAADLMAHHEVADASAWMWCLHCERAFQLGDARIEAEGTYCSYAGCEGAPLDFWSWEAYRAVTDAAPEFPQAALRYPLAA